MFAVQKKVGKKWVFIKEACSRITICHESSVLAESMVNRYMLNWAADTPKFSNTKTRPEFKIVAAPESVLFDWEKKMFRQIGGEMTIYANGNG